jgi:hypothetical protein
MEHKNKLREKLLLTHQALLEEKFKLLKVNISEYSFANLYLFKELHEYEILFGQEIFIQGKMRDGSTYLMPTSHPKTWSYGIIEELIFQNKYLFPIPEEWLVYFEKYLKEYCFSESDSDYLFTVHKLAHYPGRHLSNKRNLVKQLLNSHRVESKPLLKSDCMEALTILEDWHKQDEQEKQKTDYYAAVRAFQLLDTLHLQGFRYDVDGEPAGLMIGEWLNTTCYVLHFAKARKGIHGLYQYMYKDLGLRLEGKAEYINLEQDLGLPQLRQAKHSYQPDRLVHKYQVFLQSN